MLIYKLLVVTARHVASTVMVRVIFTFSACTRITDCDQMFAVETRGWLMSGSAYVQVTASNTTPKYTADNEGSGDGIYLTVSEAVDSSGSLLECYPVHILILQ